MDLGGVARYRFKNEKSPEARRCFPLRDCRALFTGQCDGKVAPAALKWVLRWLKRSQLDRADLLLEKLEDRLRKLIGLC